jgi:hypothetical protein
MQRGKKRGKKGKRKRQFRIFYTFGDLLCNLSLVHECIWSFPGKANLQEWLEA